MDSRQQDDMGGAQKLISFLVVLLIGIVITGGWANKFNAYVNQKAMACINFNGEVNGNLPSMVAQAISNNTTSDIKLNDSKVIDPKINTAFLVSKEQNNINNFNIQVNGFAISIADNTFGYVTSYMQREVILQDICRRYITELGISPNSISHIAVTGNIKATPNKVNISQLSNSGEISQEIYNASVIDDELLALKMVVKLSEEEIVQSETIVDCDEELYMGEEEIDEGITGSKLVFKEVTYEGLSQTEEVIVREEIIVNSTPTVIRKGTKNPYYDGVAFLARPTIGGYLSSLFGEYRTSSYHKGIDYAKDTGEDVMAAFEGKVISSGYNDGGYGNLIIIQHDNNMKTYYAHLNDIYVSEDEVIEKGEVIGSIGNTGFSTGPHLHFELRVNDEPVNPINYILE